MKLDLRRKLKNGIKDYVRTKTLNEKTCNLGEVVEEDSRFVCYVSQKKLEAFYRKNKYKFQTLNLSGFDMENPENVKLKYNKPIYYIFDGITFHNKLEFGSLYNPYIVFVACSFEKNIFTYFSDATIIFENNKYTSHWFDMYFEENYIDIRKSGNVIIQNDRIFNSLQKHQNAKFGININAKNIEITDSSIEIKDQSPLYLKANNLKLNNSAIDGYDIYIDAKNIESTSKIVGKNVAIDDSGDNVIGHIFANNILYNNISINSRKTVLSKHVLERHKLELRLLEILKNAKLNVEQVKETEMRKKEEELANTEISKLLRK